VNSIWEYLRVLLACVVFAMIEPWTADWLDFLPPVLTGAVAAAIAAAVAWLVFQIVFSRTVIRITWTDVADRAEVPDSQIRVSGAGTPPRRYTLLVSRESPTPLAHLTFRWLARRDLRLALAASQDELVLRVERGGSQVQDVGELVTFSFGKADYRTNTMDADMLVVWEGSGDPGSGNAAEFRYSARMNKRRERLVAKCALQIKANVKGAYVVKSVA